jgi:hypothetical protein
VNVDDPSDITQVVSSVTRHNLIQLFAEQSHLYHRHNVANGKFPPNL